MNKILFGGAFILGALAILWIGQLFLGADTLGLLVTVLIGGVYAIGTWELLQFRRATSLLKSALRNINQPIEDLSQWLQNCDPSLQNAVRLRVEGERNGLPAPVLTPYLVGLLVMLGLLGTFVGMVDTLKGAVVALEGSSELEAIRAGLAAPIEGLGLAFGTSVAGVAASAMLGLLSTLSRRERLQASHLLDTKTAQELSAFSAKHQQKLAFQAIQDQAQALPAVAEKLGALINGLEAMSDKIGQQLLSNQHQFQDTVTTLYKELNESVDHSLKTTLVESAKLISGSVEPMAAKTLKQLSDNSVAVQKTLRIVSEEQLEAISLAAKSNTNSVQEAVAASLAKQSESTDALVASVNSSMVTAADGLQSSSKSLLADFSDTRTQWLEQQQQTGTEFSQAIREELGLLRQDEAKRGNDAVAHLAQLETTVASQLATLGAALEAPMTRLIETASQTPKAAADVIEKLRTEMTKNLERDNDLLNERTRLMEQLNTLSSTLEASSIGQREAIDSLIERSADTLSQVGSQFSERLEGESSKLAGVVDHFASSSADMASLGDAFNAAVMMFSESNNNLVENLGQIEAALEKSTSRSDEQLAYYVAQAREIIDHNLLSHQQIIAALNAQQPEQLRVSEAN
mgnify:FL=1